MELSNSILPTRFLKRKCRLFFNGCSKIPALTLFATAITFSLQAQKLYWTEHSVRIARSDLDGASPENMLFPGGLPNGIAFDDIRNYAYWADELNQAIYRAQIDPSGGLMPQTLWIDLSPSGIPKGVDIDLVNGYFYWADEGTDEILRADITQSSPVPQPLVSILDPYDVEINLSQGKMYYTSNNPAPEMSWADLDGNNALSLFTSGSTLFLDIAVDEITGTVYFIESAGSITQMNFDGTGLASTSISVSSPMSLALDAANGKMYWVDGGDIKRANLDGSGPETLHPGLDAPQFLTIDFSTETPPRIYWTENVGLGPGGEDEIHRVGFDGSDFEVIYSGFSDEISGIEIDEANNFIYWTDAAKAEIARGDIGETGFTTIDQLIDFNPSSAGGLFDLALDVPQGMMYYTHGKAETGFTNKISRADFTAGTPQSTVAELIDLGVEEPFGIDLDVVNGKIYFTTNEDSGPTNTARLRRMNMTGPPVLEELYSVTTGGVSAKVYFRDVKVDDPNQTVHWAGGAIDAINGFIMRNDINDPVPFTTPGSFTFPGEPRGIDIDLINSKVFWVCRGANVGANPVMIMKSDFDGNNKEIIHTVTVFPSGYPGSSLPGSAFMALDLRGLAPPPPLKLTGTSPTSNAINVTSSSDLILNFDQNVDGTTVNGSNILISGHETGLIAGVFTGGGTPNITFNPATDFKPGEIITLVISDRVRGSGGEVALPVTLQFTVASGVGPGTFSTEKVISTTADGAKSIFAADIDGDGDMDIVSGSRNDNKVAWYENDGSQNFTERVISTSASSVRSVYAADVDGDGDMDVLSASITDQKVAWYENDGSENFTERIIDTNPTGPVAILAIDMDRDGDMDVVITANQDEVAWYENDGTQTFTKNIIDNTLDSPQALYAADLDADGDTDIVTVSWLDNTVAWHENDGFQSFTLHVISLSAQNPLSVFAIDIDEDGDVDILTTGFDFSRIYRWANNGSQVFSQNTVTTTLLNAIYVSAADMDGDGDIDVLGASQTDNEVVFYDNDGSEVFTENIVSSTAVAVQSVISADMDGDGDLDIISASGGDDKIAWYENVVLGCSSPPSANAGSDQSICGASVVNLSGSVANTSSSTWSTSGDGTFGNVALPNTTYTPGATDISNGTVLLTLTANDPDGAGPCIAAVSNITITIDAAATVSVGPDLSVCSSNLVNLSATTGGSASNPMWTSSGSGGFDDNTSLTATYTPDANDISNGMVNLTLTVDAAGVCPQVTDQLTVTISQPIVAASLSIQSNVSVISNVDVIAPSTINIGDVITTTIIQNPTKGTTAVLINNSVDYTANNGTVGADSFVYRICNQCGDCSDGTVTIDILNVPPVISNPTAPITTVVGQSVLIPFSTLFSDINDNIDFTSIQVVAGPTSGAATSFDSNYDLTVDYTNVNFAGTDALTVEVCDLLGDCAQITLSIEVDGEITAHNGISPNGDGKNDYFNIANIQSIEPQNKVSIYNRWGDKVFEMENYDSTNPAKRFNGKSDDGKDLPSGVYFYKISFASGTPELSGYLTLKR